MDIELLLARRVPEREHEIPGVGTVRLRGLTRAEGMKLSGIKDLALRERYALSCAMVDPVMSEAQVGLWMQAAPAGELEELGQIVAELSGMAPGADKAAVGTFPSGPIDPVRVLPGDETGSNGGGATGDDKSG